MNRILAGIAFLAMLGFIGVLVIELQRWDLWGVAILVVALLAYDLYSTLRDESRKGE